jgi:hydroxyacylglutathione hydrolase
MTDVFFPFRRQSGWNMEFVRLTVGDFETNGFVVRENNDAVIIDPGAEAELFVDQLNKWGVEPAAIIITHGHGDHIAAVRDLREQFPNAPVICHPLDAPMLSDPQLNLGIHYGAVIDVGEPDRTIEDGEVLSFGDLSFRTIHIPGHTTGHVVFYHEDGHVFAGDTLFAGGIGRFDFPDGDGRLLIRGMKEKLLALPGETEVHPGHGPSTTLQVEASTNPYLNQNFLRSMGLL